MVEFDQRDNSWEEYTSPFDRIQSVSQSVSKPRSASWIAKRAAVPESTARNHLRRLVEIGVLLQYDREGVVKYIPDPIYVRFQTIRDLWREHDQDSLVTKKEELQDQIEMWRHEFGVESPRILRELAAKTNTAEETTHIRQTANNWDLIQHRLSIVEEAIDKCSDYNE